MSSTIVTPPASLGIAPARQVAGTEVREGDSIIGNTLRRVEEFDLPGGRVAQVGVRIGLEGSPEAAKHRQEFLLSVYPPALTESLEKEIKHLSEQFVEITGYDREGKAQYRVTGRDRDIMEMRLASKQNALRLAQVDRREAESAQAAARVAEAERHARIETAAAKMAEQIAEEAEVQKRAEQIARRKHGTNGRG